MKRNSTEAIPLIFNFCQWLKEQQKSPNTISTYKRELENYQEWLQKKNSDINHLKKDNIRDYILFLEQQQKSTATIDKTIGAIRTFVKFLEKPDLTFGITTKPVEKRKDIETLSSNEITLLLNNVKEDGNLRDIAIVYVLLHTGIRVSELCKLNQKHVDFLKNELTVEKRKEDERIIPLSNGTRFYLKKYLQSCASAEAIFVTKSGNRMTERAVQYMLKKYNVNPNKLRHTFCQKLISANVDLKTVSRLAGHKDLNITKRYTNLNLDSYQLEEVINNTFISDALV